VSICDRCPVYYESLLQHPMAVHWTKTFGGEDVGDEQIRITDGRRDDDPDDTYVGTGVATLVCRQSDDQPAVEHYHVDDDSQQQQQQQSLCPHRMKETRTISTKALAMFKSWSMRSLALAPVYSALARSFPEVNFVAVDVHRMCSM